MRVVKGHSHAATVTLYFVPWGLYEREKADRASKAWRLSKLGWTVREIGERLGIGKSQVSEDVSENSHLGKIGQAMVREDRENSHLGKIPNDIGPHWNDKGIAEVANARWWQRSWRI